jgi:hypothetical protein
MVVPKLKPKHKKWQPTVSDLVGIFGILVAVIVYLARPDWEIGGGLALLAVALIVFAAFRHSSHPAWRMMAAVAVMAVFVAAIWRPLWDSFHKDYPNLALQWPVTSTARPALSPNPPDMPPLNLPGPPLSQWGKALILCQRPPKVETGNRDSMIADIKRNVEIFGKATGVDIVFNEIAYGIRLDITASSTEGQMRMAGAQRATIQIEGTTAGLLVIISIEFPGGMALLDKVTVDRGSEIESAFKKLAANMTGNAEDQCRML